MSLSSTPVISVRDLRKVYRVSEHKRGLLGAARNLFSAATREVRAVDGVSFEIDEGAFVGYIGPNGAGKSTTIKMLTGILVPSSGEVLVNGLVPHKSRKQNAKSIGLVFGQRTQLWWDLPPIEAFSLLGRMYGLSKAEREQGVGELSEILGLADFIDTPVRKLSLGQKMRCELAAALLHKPRVLFLDEPSIGLDVVAKADVQALLKRINEERRTTILLTSHDLDDIQTLCERVIVIDHGKVMHDGDLASLRNRFGDKRRLTVDLGAAVDALDLPTGASTRELRGSRAVIDLDASQITVPKLMQHLFERYDVHDVSVEEADIEDVVRALYKSGSATNIPASD